MQQPLTFLPTDIPSEQRVSPSHTSMQQYSDADFNQSIEPNRPVSHSSLMITLGCWCAAAFMILNETQSSHLQHLSVVPILKQHHQSQNRIGKGHACHRRRPWYRYDRNGVPYHGWKKSWSHQASHPSCLFPARGVCSFGYRATPSSLKNSHLFS